ncbi:MAG: YeeE/YedE family protein [Bradymonadaceae bacterium]|nr:YeeE/YedE family protein [Lujinxingiaceae bacterium]
MENFTPIASLVGGILIGLAAAAMMLFNGRVAGISGIFGGILMPAKGELSWRLTFFVGLLVGGLILLLAMPQAFDFTSGRTLAMLAAAGLLVGIGTRLGGGCTSGHGVCGLSRLSLRSLVATMTFMATGAITVFVMRVFFGGAL